MYAVGIKASTAHTVFAVVSQGGSSSGSECPPNCGEPPTPDTTAPIIDNVVVSNITESSAVITWQTDEPAETELSYGTDTGYSESPQADASYRTSHTRNLSGLSEATQYHFQIWAADSSANSTLSSDYVFTTKDNSAPIISNLQVIEITETTARVTWDTNEPATSTVTHVDLGDFDELSLKTEHSILLTELEDDQLQEITVTSVDASGNTASQDTEFYTLLNLPPTNVINFNAQAGDEQVTLEWTNPPDADFSHVSLRVSISTYPTSVTDGTEIYNGAANSYIDTGLTNNAEYFYTIFAIDNTNKVSSGASDSAIPQGPEIEDPTGTALVMEDLQILSITDTSARVTWHTNNISDSSVEVVGQGTYEDTTLVTNHSVVMFGLTKETTYSITATSKDELDQSASISSEFTTLGETITPPEEEEEEEDDGDEVETVPDPENSDIDVTIDAPTDEIPATKASIEFLVARDAIRLTPTREGTILALANRGLAVKLDLKSAPRTRSVKLRLGSQQYIMNPDSSLTVIDGNQIVNISNREVFFSRVITPNVSMPISIEIEYANDTTQSFNYNLQIQSEGVITEINTGDKIVGASIIEEYFDGEDKVWNAIPYAQQNPIQSDEYGQYAWYVPNGTYRVKVQHEDYNSLTTARINITNNIANRNIELVEFLPPLVEQIDSIDDIVPEVSKRVVNSIQVTRQNQGVQTAAKVAAPVVAATAASTFALLATSFNALRFLQYMFTAPFLLFKRRRRNKWGVIYDSLRKVPVDLAIVRLLDAQTNKVVKSLVTDRLGRFMFIADPGEYKIEVKKDGFTFPSNHLKDIHVDGDYLDLYHGETIKVNAKDTTVAVNIPLDPLGQEAKHSKKAMLLKWARRLMYTLSLVGLVVSIIVAIIDPSTWTITLALVQLIILAIFIKLAIPLKPTNWGIVYDKKTRRPLANAIVRIFDPKFNKLLETQVTDSRGRYAFLVGPSEFYTTYQKKGYEKVEVRPIDRTDTKESSYISINIPLARA